MKEFKYEIIKKIGEPIPTNADTIKIEVNRISYNNAPSKVDIRCWRLSHNDQERTMLKGLSLTDEQARQLLGILTEYYREKE
jgi:hypothetical protein